MNCLKCNFARKFPGDCKYVVCDRFGGFRRVDGECPKFGTNSDKLKGLGDYELGRFLRELACPPDAKYCEADCAACWKKWFESPADMEFWRNFEEWKDLAPEPCENCGSKLVFHKKRKDGEWIWHEFECDYCGSSWQYKEKAKKEDD